METPKKYLDIVQIFRGLAALMIVFHHINPSISFYQENNFELFNIVASIGKYGVDFFFILSGFIITYTNYNKKGIVSYLKKRFLRIYVPYIPISLVVLFLYLNYNNISNGSRDISVLTSLTLFPHGSPALSVAWTLTYEMMFYILFVLCLINKKLWNLFIIFWTVSIIVVNVYYMEITSHIPILRHLFSFYNVEFILGYILGRIFLKNYIIRKDYIIALIIVSTVFLIHGKYFAIYTPDLILNLLFSIAAFGIVYYFLTYRNKTIPKKNIFMLIGNATYSIYLVHNILISLINRFLPLSNSTFIYMLYISITFIICLIIGYVYYWIFEVRAMSIAKSILFTNKG
jgi:exopolysaccharide production protein ExoZ